MGHFSYCACESLLHWRSTVEDLARDGALGTIVVTAQSQMRGSRMQEPEPEPSDGRDRYQDYKSKKEMRPPPPAQPRRCRRCDRVAPGKRHYCCTACKERRVTGGAGHDPGCGSEARHQ